MKALQQICILLTGLFLTIATGSCNLDVTDSGNRRIVLGDSATIVTEHDTQYLEDAFTDLADTALEAQLRTDEDNFNNVAKAQQLAQQQQQDSISKAKAAAQEKKKEADSAAKKKEEQRKQQEKDKKKNVKDKRQTASQKKKAQEEKKKRRR